MGFFKFLKKKRKKKVEVQKKEDPIPEVIPVGCAICELCSKPIYPYDKRKTSSGKKFHVKCWKGIY